MWKRWQGFEIEDQPWCPALIRDYTTDYLAYIFAFLRPYDQTAPLLLKLLEQSQDKKILDIGSGAGGPWLTLYPLLKKNCSELQVILSDYFPNTGPNCRRFDAGLSYESQSINALDIPPELPKIVTLFTAFHHFDPIAAHTLIENAQAQKRSLAVFEITERNLRGLITVTISSLAVFFLTPFLKPFSWRRLFLTYCCPIVPAIVYFDGIMSVLRTYSRPELLKIAKSAAPHYLWEVGRCTNNPLKIPITFLIGQADAP